MKKIVISGSNAFGYFMIEVALGKRSPKLFILDPKTIMVGLGKVQIDGTLSGGEQKVLFTFTKGKGEDHWLGFYETEENNYKSKFFILTTHGHNEKPTASLYYVTEEKNTSHYFLVFLGSMISKSKYIALKVSARYHMTDGGHKISVSDKNQKIDQNLLLKKTPKEEWSFGKVTFPASK